MDAVSAYRATVQPASDVRVYREWINGPLPSWTVPGPYPLGADLVWWPLRWVHGSPVQSNLWWLVGCTVPVTLLACLVLARTASRPLFAITVWLVAAALLERSYWMRLEPVGALAALLMIVGVRRASRAGAAGSALALAAGAMIKVWPAFLAPLALLVSGGGREGARGRSALRWLAWFTAPWAVYLLVVAALRPPHPMTWLTFNLSRRIQVESFSALPALWAMATGSNAWQVRFVNGLDSTEVMVGPHLHAPRYLLQALAMVVIIALAVRVVRWRLSAPDGSAGADRAILSVALSTQVALLIAIIIAGPVFSPQYLVWFAAPLAVAVGEGLLGREALVWLVACGLTFLEFPTLWARLETADPLALAVLTTRDAVLVGLLVLCLRRVRRETARRTARTRPAGGVPLTVGEQVRGAGGGRA